MHILLNEKHGYALLFYVPYDLEILLYQIALNCPTGSDVRQMHNQGHSQAYAKTLFV
jgi:hypothetical protein